MMTRFNVFLIAILLPVMALTPCVCAQDAEGDPEGVDRKSEVVNAVSKAVAILEEEGEAGLEKVGEIRFSDGNYVFVNDLNAVTLMHIKKQLIGRNLIALKDDTGKRFFAEFHDVVKSTQTTRAGHTYYDGSGWVRYRWPKPGEEEFSPKVTYVKGCLMGDKNVYVGAGYYE